LKYQDYPTNPSPVRFAGTVIAVLLLKTRDQLHKWSDDDTPIEDENILTDKIDGKSSLVVKHSEW
jgi:hypothetical protein